MNKFLLAAVFPLVLICINCPATVPVINDSVLDNALGLETETADTMPTLAAIAVAASAGGATGPRVTLSQSLADFGNRGCGGGPWTITVTIQNTGTDSLTMTTPFTFSGNSQFVIFTPGSSTLAPGGSTTFDINFDTSGGASGSKNGTITIMSNATNSSQALPVTANQTASC